MSSSDSSAQSRIPGRSTGDGELPLTRFREYLHVLVRMQLGKKYQGKLDASDIVQQTMLEAHRNRSKFRGTTSAELAGWLRGITANRLSKAVRGLHCVKRNLAVERSLQEDLNQSSARLEKWLASDESSPSMRFDRQEQVLWLATALAELPDSQREALVLRHCHGWTLLQIAEHLGCTPPAVIGFLKRGIKHVRAHLDTCTESEPDA